MPINIPRGNSDKTLERIKKVLQSYAADYPHAQIDLYRQNPVSVRIRIINPEFAHLSRVARHERVWNYLDSLSEDTQSDISMLLLLTPDEAKKSFANIEFEDPVSSPT
jgi:stress-induced morphogen